MDGAAFDQIVRRLELAAGRRTLLAGLAAAGLAGGAAARPDLAAAKKKPKKVTICRKGQTLSVKKKKKRKHLKPGDTAGPCPATTRPPATTLPPRCPAAKPNFCARLDTCQAACTAGHAFDAESCACVCSPATTCCVCEKAGVVNFHSDLTSDAACQQRCADDGATFRDFKGGNGSAAAFDFTNDVCRVTCEPEQMTCPAGFNPETCDSGAVCCPPEADGGCCGVDAPNCCLTFCCGPGFPNCCPAGGCCSVALPLCCGTVCCLEDSACCTNNDDCDTGQFCSRPNGIEVGCCVDDPERARGNRSASLAPMTPAMPRRRRGR